MASSSSSQSDEAYLRQHDIGPVLDALLQDVLLVQPPNPYEWMADQLKYLLDIKAVEARPNMAAAQQKSMPSEADRMGQIKL